jgi:putative ABC transport system substrate-binding protein
MRRRKFIFGIVTAAAVWPIPALGQRTHKVAKIGVLMGGAETDPSQKADIAALAQALQKLGWADGRTVQVNYRFGAGDPDKMRAFAKELVGLKPDVIVGDSTAGVLALARETKSIPVVFVMVADPVGSGFVASFARPGGNFTGFSNFVPSLAGKWVELLKELAPRVERIALLYKPETAPFAGSYLTESGVAAKSLGVTVIPLPVRDISEMERLIATLGSGPQAGLVALPDIFTYANRERIITLAAQYRIPAVHYHHAFPAHGGLMSYGVNVPDLFRRAAAYVDRILRGEKPTDLAVQAPTRFELIINRKTAKALGLNVSPHLLVRADEVIE